MEAQQSKHNDLAISSTLNFDTVIGDEAWVEVIQQMDAIYADLVESQVELEDKNAELEEAHLFIESILSTMHNILIVTDTASTILRINKALENLIGKTNFEIKGESLDTLFSKSESNKKQIKKVAQKIRSGILFDCEIEMANEDNEPVPISLTCKGHYDHSGKLIGSVITGRPLGEIRKAYLKLKQTHEKLKTTQQQLLQSEKMASLGRLIAGVAHELNNPISFVFGNMYALQRYEERFQHYIESIHQNISVEEREKLRRELKIDRILKDVPSLLEGSLESAERVKNIVHELRGFVTPNHHKNTPVDIAKLVDKAIHLIVHSSDITPTIMSDMPKELVVNTNEGYVHQIVINLLQNAIDAIELVANPLIEVILSIKNDVIQISIRDNGAGISKENMNLVFDPFFTTKPVGKGTGLGLYISYDLAKDQCNGSLTADNHQKGGAIFTLSLPNV
jgi:two-component system sensor histidine kinase HupT/HoxJ